MPCMRPPDPRLSAKIRVGTAITAVLVALLFGICGVSILGDRPAQPAVLDVLTQLSTWSYLLAGLRGYPSRWHSPLAASRWFWASPSCSGAHERHPVCSKRSPCRDRFPSGRFAGACR